MLLLLQDGMVTATRWQRGVGGCREESVNRWYQSSMVALAARVMWWHCVGGGASEMVTVQNGLKFEIVAFVPNTKNLFPMSSGMSERANE